MCGIAGVLDQSQATSEATLHGMAFDMQHALRHRGPDGHGIWCDPEGGIALTARRLAVVELSPEGHQPMHSACGRYVVSFNGEVYNQAHLRALLDDAVASRSDTAVLLAAIARWGVVPALQKVIGAFAIGLWDRRDRTLYLARDRIGEKPVYYGKVDGRVVFGSELKAFCALPGFGRTVDRSVLALYLRLGYVPGPYSIYQGVFKVPPGTVVAIRPVDEDLPAPQPYWSLRQVVDDAEHSGDDRSASEVIDELDGLLRDAVSLQMISEVPLGVFFSGGVDSSLIAALIQAQSPRPVTTFTLAMPGSVLDEAEPAHLVARHLGTEHTAVEFSADDAMAMVPRLPDVYDEPFGDPSQLPTLFIAEAASGKVKVGLSGDGGDEMFGGYNRYVFGRSASSLFGAAPEGVRRVLAAGMTALTPNVLDRAFRAIRPVLPRSLDIPRPGDRMEKLAQLLRTSDPALLYLALVTCWGAPEGLVGGTKEAPTLLTDRRRWPRRDDATERMMFLDAAVALPDDMLTKFDRACMKVGIEARAPFLDHRVVEFAWGLPIELKIRDRQGKWPLRQLLSRYVPLQLVDRPKVGFDPPIADWLRGPLREWAESLLFGSASVQSVIDLHPVQIAWKEHLANQRNHDYRLWLVLMLLAWTDASGAST